MTMLPVIRKLQRYLDEDGESYFFSFWTNYTSGGDSNDFDSNLVRPEDVSVDAVLSSLYFNSIAFVCLMAIYECLRRALPTVYSSRKRMDHVHLDEHSIISEDLNAVAAMLNHDRRGTKNNKNDPLADDFDDEPNNQYRPPPDGSSVTSDASKPEITQSMSSFPDEQPLDWVAPVFGVAWNRVRKKAGLDGYFFLRYIRMNVRITAVSAVWFFLILVPIYVTGPDAAHSWYRISAANVPNNGWRIWAACIFAYLFAAFVTFVIKQEYRHFLELRQEFLAKGTAHVHPQHHYSVMVENIPRELRSDKALKEYFEKLFPGKVHSASVVLNVPDLEEASMRCIRSVRRLEKSIALLHATKLRPTHIVGRGRLTLLGIDFLPIDCQHGWCSPEEDRVVYLDDDSPLGKPSRGTRVDSISYYMQELAANSRTLLLMQRRKYQIAESGNMTVHGENWFDDAIREIYSVADMIMKESLLDNSLLSNVDADVDEHDELHAERMTSRYGSFGSATLDDSRNKGSSTKESEEKLARLVEQTDGSHDVDVPFARDQYRSLFRRWAGRLGLDFVVAVARALDSQVDVTLEGVNGATMSSTGFVTFLDLSSTTCVASAPLSAKASVLNVSVAPEPREIYWENAHVSQRMQRRRGQFVDVILVLGAFLWSFPLAAIQAFARAELLAQIPGMSWILTFRGGALTQFVNGYLPVIALLGLILILPVIFETVATRYERRKTFSDIQSSMLSRYFYYQLANIYISVTAGSILKSLAETLDHPSSFLDKLGASIPTMVGYFIALLITKIMAGLPMIFLRFGALFRMLLLRLLSQEKKLTQRELDAIYRLENVQYGWEFPTQLLVVVIVFTYAVICPIILLFGFIYFSGALIVYKKQILYVYSPVYESGGTFFPIAVQHTLFGLVCGQLTLLGYTVTRGCYYQPAFLLPLPILTVYAMNYFQRTFADPCRRLSLERARAYDRLSQLRATEAMGGLVDPNLDAGVEMRKRTFDKNAFRQPVLTEVATEPWPYRRGVEDKETMDVREQLRMINRYMMPVPEEQDGMVLEDRLRRVRD